MNIVAVTPDRENYIKPMERFLEYPLVFHKNLDWDEFLALEPKAAIFLGDWTWELSEFVRKCRLNKIPSILMMDGTIEWKHFFENPKWSFGSNEAPYFPIQCDKIFVPGESTFKFLEFFGNHGKCEITGLPRLDHYSEINNPKSVRTPKIIGIMSGNTAGYTEEQIEQSKKLFEDIYSWSLNQSEFEVKWRLRKGFDKILDIKIENDQSPNLIDFINKVDAVICQPGTATYEAMFLGIPVALADYSIAPNYMHAAWEIHSANQIDKVIGELMNPSNLKLSLQEQILNYNISFCGKSAQICGLVINEMIKISKELSDKWIFPKMMVLGILKKLEIEIENIQTSLFPQRTAYNFTEVTLLQENYTKIKKQNDKLKYELSRRSIGFWMDKLIQKIAK